MFNIFKKKEEQVQGVEKKENYKENKEGKGEVVKEADSLKERMEKEIIIHTMPKKFILDNDGISKAKTIGMIIIGAGAVLIIVSSALVYYYFFRIPKEEPLSITEQIMDKRKDKGGEESDIFPVFEEGQDKESGSEGAKLPTGLEPETSTTTEESLEDLLPEELEPEATSTPADATINNDTDNDGLTDNEEILLGSYLDNTDSDGDGYDDLAEVMNLYNPVGTNKLIDNLNIGKYENLTFGYSIFYPVNWAKSTIGGDDSVMFKSPDNHFVQIIVQPNADQQSIDDWYKEQFAVTAIDPGKKISVDSWQGIESGDGLFFYLTDENKEYIFVISYIPGSDNILSYKNIFKVMVKSLEIGS